MKKDKIKREWRTKRLKEHLEKTNLRDGVIIA